MCIVVHSKWCYLDGFVEFDNKSSLPPKKKPKPILFAYRSEFTHIGMQFVRISLILLFVHAENLTRF